MKLKTVTIPGSKNRLQFGSGEKAICDYRLSFSYVAFSIPEQFITVFPRIGFLTFTMVTGNDIETRFLNYEGSVTRPNHLYISGLFTDSSLKIKQTGTGGGYAMKVHPVVGYHFLKIPMYELLNRQVRICRIIDSNGQLLEKVESDYKITSFDDPYIHQFFEEALPPKTIFLNDPIYHTVNSIIKKRGIISVKKLAKQCFMSRRTLNRQFQLKVGLSPQAYAKIWQVHYAMELIQQNPNASLAEIAFKAGYYDVAHLARDFRNKVALPPSELHQVINPLSQDYLDAPGVS
ncbi:AraC family transcriptional regulator [Rhodohalobacter sp. SW132]|uniref:helix-turn-helix domain-containing protein n=1 Tax=Rhodohalobacter sp. SW132 TaxID=2293433 RepID=UPI000E26F51C|nr:helix-turn-helix domain-containing protein [Rhodohalobacter sp. SW132]REL33436.1 AraC family transcriptional regulator [Rhodohalobacter sp. SW132]